MLPYLGKAAIIGLIAFIISYFLLAYLNLKVSKAIPLGLFISYLTLLYQKVLGMRELISVQSVFILPFSTITDIS
ncbi:MAG: hypothetical protein K5931_06695, partial [Lachnospiraceae bacterium]|nr:hypothetical protein [Lachnospiraceae bacterium]